jgi:hypothetical protein
LRHRKAKSCGAGPRVLTLLLAALLSVPQPLLAADLNPATVSAFGRYTQLTQLQFDTDNARHDPFLWVDGLAADQRTAAYAQLRAGQVVIDQLETTDGGKPIAVPGGLIHHWIGTVFIPGATLAETLAFESDYDHQQQYFSPNVIRSRIVSHTGADYTIGLRFHQKKIVTVVLDTEDQVHYGSLDATKAWSRSWTTRVQQVDHPGESNESLEPAGHDDGFLWAMDTYWRFEQKDGGTYVESQSVLLTRDIPTGLGWMIGPFVTSVPRESLTFLLAATRSAILQWASAGSKN